jgi:hypothetical protein
VSGGRRAGYQLRARAIRWAALQLLISSPLTLKPVFGLIEQRRELLQRLGAGDSVEFTDAALTRYRSIPLSKIAADPDGPTKIASALRWMEEQIESQAGSHQF